MFIYTGYTQQYDSNIPLQSVAVNASLVDTFGEVTISQTYKNNYSKDIEAIYCFNLDTHSSVTRMVLVLNGKRMVSEIKEKTQARSTYSKAKSEHKTTCLLEYHNDGSYKVSLGNVQAGQEIVVELTYVTTLDYSAGVARFVLPTNISQKYTGSSNKTVKDVLSSVAPSLTYSKSANYLFNFSLNYKSHNAINGVKSQTNEIQVTPVSGEELSPKEVNVTSTSMPSSGDFNLLIETVVAPGIYYSTQGDTTYLAVTHKIPDQTLDLMTVQKEFIFVVDRSGSMGDRMNSWSSGGKSKIELAKEALKLFINSLPPKSTFNVYSFGNKFKAMFPESVSVTNDVVKTALDQIDSFGSDMGGTEIFSCLEQILSGAQAVATNTQPIDLSKRVWKPDPASEYEKVEPSTVTSAPEKVLILLTDGQVSNSDAVIGLCEQYNYLSRVFCIGIGSDVDRNLVTGVSSASNGYAEMLVDNDDVSSAVIKMLDSSLKSFYKFVGATIGGQRSSEHVLYPSQSLNFFKVMSTEAFGKLTEVTVSGINGLSGEVESWVVHVTSKSESPAYLRQLWANDRIRAYLNDNNRNKYANEIIKLSIEHSLATTYTSFVVVDEIVHQNQSGDPITVNVPQYSGESIDLLDGGSVMAFGCASSAPIMRGGSVAKTGRSFGALKSKMVTRSAPVKCASYSSNGSSDDECDEEEEVMEAMSADMMMNACAEKLESLSKQSATLGSNASFFGRRQDECERAPLKSRWGASPFSLGSSSTNVSAPASVSTESVQVSSGFSFGKLFGGQKNSKNVDYLLNFKNADGSFRYDEKVLKTIGVSTDKFNTVISTQGVSQDYLLNVLILAYIKGVNDSKYTMIQKMLESWLSANKSTEVPESVTQELLA